MIKKTLAGLVVSACLAVSFAHAEAPTGTLFWNKLWSKVPKIKTDRQRAIETTFVSQSRCPKIPPLPSHPWPEVGGKPGNSNGDDKAPCVSKETCLLAAVALKDWICDHVDVASHIETDPNIDKIYQDAMKKWGSECGNFEIVTVPDSEDFWVNYKYPPPWSPSEIADDCVKKAKQYLGPPDCGDGVIQKGEECDLGKDNGKKFTNNNGETIECDSTCHEIKPPKPSGFSLCPPSKVVP